ncbi:MAG: hypothetical protein JNL49_10395 [Bacteroidia bacterium]|nr:hypothetical protein [Bacteroidia bacterium]
MFKLLILSIFITFPALSVGQKTSARDSSHNFNGSAVHSPEVAVGDKDLVLTEISEKEFQKFLSEYKISCKIDSGKFVEGSGIYVRQFCDEICETYLYEQKTNNRLILPSDYDSGILGMLFSTSCNQFLVYSSYDGPDYDKYYDHRSELFIFSIAHGEGLNGVRQQLQYFSKSWSIENLVWVNEKSIALKVYEGEKQGDDSMNKYKFYLTDFLK